MFSRTLTKLIDEAILPAVLLIAAKVLGVILAARYYGIELPTVSFFPLYFPQLDDFLKVNSLSMAFMSVVVFFGGLSFLVKSRLLQDTRVTPRLAASLFSLNLGKFLQTSMDVYSEGTVWVSYSILALLVVGLQLYFGLVSSWVFLVALAVCVFLVLIFVSDVDRELKARSHGEIK